MLQLVPFEPGMEGHFVPYEAIEEGLAEVIEAGLVPITQKDQKQLPATDNNSSEQKIQPQ